MAQCKEVEVSLYHFVGSTVHKFDIDSKHICITLLTLLGCIFYKLTVYLIKQEHLRLFCDDVETAIFSLIIGDYCWIPRSVSWHPMTGTAPCTHSKEFIRFK